MATIREARRVTLPDGLAGDDLQIDRVAAFAKLSDDRSVARGPHREAEIGGGHAKVTEAIEVGDDVKFGGEQIEVARTRLDVVIAAIPQATFHLARGGADAFKIAADKLNVHRRAA